METENLVLPKHEDYTPQKRKAFAVGFIKKRANELAQSLELLNPEYGEMLGELAEHFAQKKKEYDEGVAEDVAMMSIFPQPQDDGATP